MKTLKIAQLVRISAMKRDMELGRMAVLTSARSTLQAERADLKAQVTAALRGGQNSAPTAAHADNFSLMAQHKDELMALDQARLESDIATQKTVAALAVGRADVIERLAQK